jgi:hypothetical protein
MPAYAPLPGRVLPAAPRVPQHNLRAHLAPLLHQQSSLLTQGRMSYDLRLHGLTERIPAPGGLRPGRGARLCRGMTVQGVPRATQP